MPKKTYKILRFEGGLNSAANPRDIAENELADLDGVRIDSIGRVIVSQDFKNEIISANQSSNIIKAVSTDYVDMGGTQADKTLYITQGTTPSNINIIGTESAVSNPITVANLNSAAMYWADGALRIYDATISGATLGDPTWYGYIHSHIAGQQIGSSSFKATVDAGWYKETADIKGCFPEITLADGTKLCQNVITGVTWGHAYAIYSETHPSGNGFYKESTSLPSYGGPSFTHGQTKDQYTDVGKNDGSPVGGDDGVGEKSGMSWGIAIEFAESSNGISETSTGVWEHTSAGGGWSPTGKEKYRLWITTLYDENRQESLPQICSMFELSPETSELKVGYLNTQVQSEVYLKNPRATPVKDIGVGQKGFKVWYSISMVAGYKAGGSGAREYVLGATDVLGYPDIDATTGGNPRIKGFRLYWSDSTTGHSDLWRLLEMDVVKGVSPIGIGDNADSSIGYVPWTGRRFGGLLADAAGNPVAQDVNEQAYGLCAAAATSNDQNYWINPPKFYRYDTSNAHSPLDIITVEGFKTSCMANRRIYIGNVKQDGKIYGDRMLKSPVNQFDKFPEAANNIDVTINDGEDIVLLMEYADRILQFKQNTLYIINVSGDSEFLEAEAKFKGISHPGGACKTDSGVVWCNRFGAFLYDGKKVSNLIESKGQRKLDGSIWASFIGTNSKERAGYMPKTNQAIFKGNGNDAYLYDMVLQNWAFINSAFAGSDISNFDFSSYDGQPIYSTTTGIYGLNDVQPDSTNIKIKTKDIDFGEPGVNKSISSVRISYKGGVIGAVPQKTKVDCIANTADILDGKHIMVTFKDDTTETGTAGKTTIWFDTTGSTTEPTVPGSDGNIKVTGVSDGDSAEIVALHMAAAIDNYVNGDTSAVASCVVNGTAVTITDVDNAIRADAIDGNTGFSVSTLQDGRSTTSGSFLANVKYGVNGGDVTNTFDVGLDSSSTDLNEVKLTPTTPATAKNIKSFQLEISGYVPPTFELNDISVIYREKTVK